MLGNTIVPLAQSSRSSRMQRLQDLHGVRPDAESRRADRI
jgi:hypothetical protein